MTAGRVRHQLQVNQRGLDAGVSQPPAEVAWRNPAQRQVAGVTVPRGVCPDVPAVFQLTGIGGPPRRLLNTLPGP